MPPRPAAALAPPDLATPVTASAALAQSFAAQLENARLLFQAELAQDYFQLHGIDSEIELLDRTENGGQVSWRFESGRTPDLGTRDAAVEMVDDWYPSENC